MLGRFRSAIYNAIGNLEEEGGVAPPRQGSPTSQTTVRQKYNYQRPAFLKLETEDEIQVLISFYYASIILIQIRLKLVLVRSRSIKISDG